MAQRWKKFAGMTLLVLIALIVLGITFTIGWRPFIGAKKRALNDRKFDATPQRMARGKYLVNSVQGCFGCHSELDWSKPGAPPMAGREGAGLIWTEQDMPWLVAPNITPDKETGAGNWSDDALARAIREGIGHDGRTLFPIMPYPSYQQMSDEDLASIIVYLRSVPAIRNQLPSTKMPFPLNFFIQNLPQPIMSAVNEPDSSTPVARGAYLTRMSSCSDCHTPQVKGQPIAGMDFAGGFILKEPHAIVAASNITPDASGISFYDEAMFIRAMREGKVGARPLHASMPWIYFGKMTDEDLKAVFAFLRTLKPVRHHVDNAEAASPCKLCQQNHGLGSTN